MLDLENRVNFSGGSRSAALHGNASLIGFRLDLFGTSRAHGAPEACP